MATPATQFDPKKTVYVIDGSSFLYRAYYSLRPLHAPSGVPVQAVFSFCRMLKKLIDECGMEYIALVWDSKGKTTRHTLYSEYKATRQAPPSDIFDQKELLLIIAETIGIKQVATPGIEADDIMYSIAQEQLKKGMRVVLITLDKDMRQAVGDGIWLFDPIKQQLFDAPSIEQLMNGIPVDKIPFYFALIGDASDNIPGVKGIGPKSAHDLVMQFDSLEAMYKNIFAVDKARTRQLLQDQKENAFLSYTLFLLQYHPTGLDTQDFFFDMRNWNKAYPLFAELGFKSLLSGSREQKQENQKIDLQEKITYWASKNFVTITDKTQLIDLCQKLNEAEYFACDTETDGLSPLRCNLVGISVSLGGLGSWYIPCGNTSNEQQLSLESIKGLLEPIFACEQIKKIMHHAKFDMLVLAAHGMPVKGLLFDTMIAARLCMKEWQKIGLKDLSRDLFNEEMLSFDELVKQPKLPDFAHVSLELATLYAAADSYQTFKLFLFFKKELEVYGLTNLYETIEHPLITVLYEMELAGIKVDSSKLASLGVDVTRILNEVEDRICQYAGVMPGVINLNSPKQIEQLLFYTLKLPPQKKSGKGLSYSTDYEVLIALKDKHPVVEQLLQYRELSKLKNTYIDVLPSCINKKTGCIHTSFSQTGVATGRLSSSDPNLQNIPASGYGLAIRDAFISHPDTVFISADYSQIELRVLAHLSHDERLIDAFKTGRDIHTETAAGLFDVSVDQVSHEQRQIGKRINFSVLYGLTPYGLSRDLGISFSDAKQFITKYFSQYPAVSSWMDSIIAGAKKNGFVETAYKRRRYIPAIHERNNTLYQEACRVAVNTVVQGTAADIMKLGMIALDTAFKKHTVPAYLVLQIHDELLIESKKETQIEAELLIRSILEHVVAWQIPLQVTIRSGPTWKSVSK